MTHPEQLEKLLKDKAELTAMLAPSFPVVYSFPEIIAKLKSVGFSKVVEVSTGACFTNKLLIDEIKKNPEKRFITAPCPTIVRLIRNKYKHLEKYLATVADSPMIATAKIVKEKYPRTTPVFIGPCNTKKFEAQEDYPELGIVSVTFTELDEIIKKIGISETRLSDSNFDVEENQTRLYPISGGLVQSSKSKEFLSSDQISVVSGPANSIEALENFEENKEIKLLDILWCDGGCLNGPGINSPLNLQQRREKILDYYSKDPVNNA